MVSYQQLTSEPEWGAQFISPVMNAGLLGPLRSFYDLGPNSVGAAGDNNHLYGRHRSYAWDEASRFCTDPSYGTTAPLDQGGNKNWYRACDVGIMGQPLFEASHRMDQLARSDKCPGLAEWFGTFDGVTVVGWFEGSPSSSDSSHLFHLHVGIWNSYANDASTMQLLYATITGTAAASVQEEDMSVKLIAPDSGPYAGGVFKLYPTDLGMAFEPLTADLAQAVALWGSEVHVNDPRVFGTPIEELRALWASMGGSGGGSGPSTQAIADSVAKELSSRLED
jgi:hypothetical protein